jgi:ribosomal protein S18 acetylase RimI-like enzyme
VSLLIHDVHKTQEYFLKSLSQETLETRGITAFAIGNMEPNLNWALQTDDFEDNLETTIHAVETFYETLGYSWRWVMNPTMNQEKLLETLRKRGYGLAYTAPVLGGSLEEPLHSNTRLDFDIREVGADKLVDWILPLKEAFQATEEDALLYQNAHLRALKKGAAFRPFVAYADGLPVSASTLSLSPSGARLDDLGTHTAYQRKGYGAAMALHRMKIAKDLGYDWICLEASEQGALLYRQMGFQELYRLKVYRKKRFLQE